MSQQMLCCWLSATLQAVAVVQRAIRGQAPEAAMAELGLGFTACADQGIPWVLMSGVTRLAEAPCLPCEHAISGVCKACIMCIISLLLAYCVVA